MKRCFFCNLNNPKYVEYHDKEWGVLNLEETHLFEMLLLESFQAGLSWECILNKRDAFREAFDGFDYLKISQYDSKKIEELRENSGIVRNRLKIESSILNAKVFLEIQKEFGSFAKYLESFTKGRVLYETSKTTNDWSDAISKDLRRRGMKFVGSTIIYSFLQAVGIINSHERDCFLFESR